MGQIFGIVVALIFGALGLLFVAPAMLATLPFLAIYHYPWLSFVAAAGVLGYHYSNRRIVSAGRIAFADPASVTAACAWIGYWFYERHMQAWEKTVHEPIRADLFFVAPSVEIVTCIAVIASYRMRRRRKEGER